MANTKNKHDPSSQIFKMLENNLPKQNSEENTEPINGSEFILWMIGITAALTLLRYAFLLII
ncbi:MAG: hypothetical protein EHM64_14225 [Ignavibacteriae bacterium]|nr:MAG: hypothetical protein EHM64_14225 [Ignavibacteriota bacterium]